MRRRLRQAGAATFATVIAAGTLGVSSAAAGSTIGSAGLEPPDPFYPELGNGGYDVGHYLIELESVSARGRSPR